MTSETSGTNEKKVEVSPTEDLMREHGILHRILLIYHDILRYLNGQKIYNKIFINPIIFSTATITQQFIENYHQNLEEDYVFPKLIEKPEYSNLISVLRKQHDAARNLTNHILYFSSIKNTCFFENYQLIRLLSSYIHMYDPHSAREDTVVFPAFHQLTTPSEFEELGERFEQIEEQKFGKNGFEHIVNEVSTIEKLLGIYNLAQYTPVTGSLEHSDK